MAVNNRHPLNQTEFLASDLSSPYLTPGDFQQFHSKEGLETKSRNPMYSKPFGSLADACFLLTLIALNYLLEVIQAVPSFYRV